MRFVIEKILNTAPFVWHTKKKIIRCNEKYDKEGEVVEYKGQEKVKVKTGEFEGAYGYVRLNTTNDHLLLVLDNGRKASVPKDDVEFIHPNYFIEGIDKASQK